MSNAYRLPWDDDPRDRWRFRALWIGFLVLTLIAGLWLASIELPERPRAEREKLPPQLAKVLLEKKKIPPAPKTPEKKKITPEKKKPKPEKIAERPKVKPKPVAKPKPQSEPVRQAQVQKKVPTRKEVERAREVARQSGLLAEADALSDLRELVTDDSPLLEAKPVAKAAAKDIVQTPTEKLVSQAKTGKSGGLAGLHLRQARVSKEALAARQKAAVKAPVEAGEGEAAQVAAASRAGAGRTSEEIRRVFDANKGTIMRIYARALRKNPSLEGRFVPELTIEPSGQVSACRVITSELGEPALEKNLCRRLKTLNFGKKPGAPQQVVQYTFDFLPS